MVKEVTEAWLLQHTANTIAAEFHHGQIDNDGNPYYNHLKRVVDSIMNDFDFDYIDKDERIFILECTVVAYLKDILKNTTCTEEYLRTHGISEKLIDGIKSLTIDSGESYDDFMKRCVSNVYGKVVIVHDLEDKLDIKRVEQLTIDDLNILNNHLKWYHYLNSY